MARVKLARSPLQYAKAIRKPCKALVLRNADPYDARQLSLLLAERSQHALDALCCCQLGINLPPYGFTFITNRTATPASTAPQNAHETLTARRCLELKTNQLGFSLSKDSDSGCASPFRVRRCCIISNLLSKFYAKFTAMVPPVVNTGNVARQAMTIHAQTKCSYCCTVKTSCRISAPMHCDRAPCFKQASTSSEPAEH